MYDFFKIQIDAENWKAEGKLEKICEERNFHNRGPKSTTKEMVLVRGLLLLYPRNVYQYTCPLKVIGYNTCGSRWFNEDRLELSV